jgi:hypothetical protein
MALLVVIVDCATFKNYDVQITSKIKMLTRNFLKATHLVQKLKKETH